MHIIEQRLQALTLSLPRVPEARGPDLAWKITADWLHIGGQLPWASDALVAGRIGDELDLSAGCAAARLCALSVLAQARHALSGDWDRFQDLARITVHINAAAGFLDLDAIATAASEVFLDVLRDRGTHVRSVLAASALPNGAAVQIDALAQVKPWNTQIGLFP